MVWAVLVAVGVAVVSMTLFGARLTRRPTTDRIVEEIETHDPSDPWAAWKPREFDEIDRPRHRVWPVISAFTGLLLVGAGFAGARQTLWAAESGGPAADGRLPKPYTVQVDIPASPTMKPTPKPTATPVPPTPRPTTAPAASTASTAAPASTSAPAATTAPAGTGPTLAGSANCSGGTLSLTYSATAHGADLSWIAVYVDGKAVKGGPVSGGSHSSSYSGAATPGDHDLEVTVEDKAGRTSRKVFHSRCG